MGFGFRLSGFWVSDISCYVSSVGCQMSGGGWRVAGGVWRVAGSPGVRVRRRGAPGPAPTRGSRRSARRRPVEIEV